MSGGKIAETIFSLRRLSFSAGNDGAVVFENEESDHNPPTSDNTTNRLQSARDFCLTGLTLLLVLGTIIGFVCLAVLTNNRLQHQQEQIDQLKSVIKENSGGGSGQSLDHLTKSVTLLEHNFNERNHDNSLWAQNVTDEIEKLKEDSALRFSNFIQESNVTLCSDKKILSVPVASEYRLDIEITLGGHVYPGQEIGHLTVNDQSVSGGTISLSALQTNTSVPCGQQQCHRASHALVTRLFPVDVVKLIIPKTQRAIDNKICARFSDIPLPTGVSSMIVS